MLLKKVVSAFILVLLLSIIFTTLDVNSYTGGSPAGYTHSPFDNKTCTYCHQHVGQPHFKQDMITSNIPAGGFIAGETYAINLNISTQHTNKFGFICSPHTQTGVLQGDLIITQSNKTKIVGSKYVTHTSGGSTGSNYQQNWTFDWTAPSDTAAVTFYAAFTAGNVNNDSTFTSTYTVYPNTTHINSKENYNAFVVFPNPVIDFLNIRTSETYEQWPIIQIFNTSGKIVSVGNLNNSQTQIDLSKLANGIYFLKIISEKKHTQLKIIKQN